MSGEIEKNVEAYAPKWYAVRVGTNQEGKVKAHLEQFIPREALEDYILEVLVPSKTVVEFKNGKKTEQVFKFYPGYVFVYMRLYDNDGQVLQKPWEFVRNAYGVSGFLGRERPRAMTQKEIDIILESVKSSEGRALPKVDFKAGETVRINDGVFKNSTGQIDYVDSEHGKVRVSVSLFGRLTPVELDYWQVEKINIKV